MKRFYSPSTRGFYIDEVHGKTIPADAVEISERKHLSLLEAHGSGAEIVHTDKGPVAKLRKPDRSHLVDVATRRVKGEARKRILAVASLERQSNDNALIALAALARSGTGAHLDAVERRRKIDAIRAASNTIEAELAGLSAAELGAFSAARSPLWPIE